MFLFLYIPPLSFTQCTHVQDWVTNQQFSFFFQENLLDSCIYSRVKPPLEKAGSWLTPQSGLLHRHIRLTPECRSRGPLWLRMRVISSCRSQTAAQGTKIPGWSALPKIIKKNVQSPQNEVSILIDWRGVSIILFHTNGVDVFTM